MESLSVIRALEKSVSRIPQQLHSIFFFFFFFSGRLIVTHLRIQTQRHCRGKLEIFHNVIWEAAGIGI